MRTLSVNRLLFCPSQPRPVTFTTPEAYVRLQKLNFGRNGRISLRFKTIEPNGLLLFNGGQRGATEFVAVEMFDGIVYFVVNFGDGVQRYPMSSGRADDGREHHVKIARSRGRVTLSFDDEETAHRVRNDNPINLATFLYVGGVNAPSGLPWHLWTRAFTAKNMFVGCLWDLRVNPGDEDDIVDLPAFVKDQGVEGMEEGCRSMSEECAARPCINGVCRDRATGFFCDCSATPYTSARCNIREFTRCSSTVSVEIKKYHRLMFAVGFHDLKLEGCKLNYL